MTGRSLRILLCYSQYTANIRCRLICKWMMGVTISEIDSGELFLKLLVRITSENELLLHAF